MILRKISCWLWLTTKPEELPGQACIFWPFNVSLQMIARQIIAWTDNGDKFLEKKMVLVDVCVNVIVYAKSG